MRVFAPVGNKVLQEIKTKALENKMVTKKSRRHVFYFDSCSLFLCIFVFPHSISQNF